MAPLTPQEKPNGLAAAALLAGGIGATALGLTTSLSEASAAIGNMLRFYAPVGPLSGKTTVAVIVWLIAWVILSLMWKDRDVDLDRVAVWSLGLLGLGLLGTFPPFFDLFAGS